MAGIYKLTFKGHSTDSLSYNAVAADIQVYATQTLNLLPRLCVSGRNVVTLLSLCTRRK